MRARAKPKEERLSADAAQTSTGSSCRAVDSLRRRMRRIERKLQPPFASILDTCTPRQSSVCVGANPDSVKRLLRALAAHGVFAELRDGRFSLTPLSESLRVDAPDSARGIVLFWGDPLHWEHWGSYPTRCRRAARPLKNARQAGVRLAA